MRTFLALALPLAALPVIAQPKTDKATVEWGPDLTEKTTGEFQYVFGQSDEAVYMLFRQKRELLVQKMNTAMVVLYSKPLDLELDKKDLVLQKVLLAGTRIIAFANLYDRKADLNVLFMRSFDEANMQHEGGWERVAQFDSKKAWAGDFNVRTSPDEEHILVSINLPYDKDAPEVFRLRVYDSDMKPEWDREVTMPHSDREFTLERFRVDNKGDVIGVGYKYAEKREAKALKRAGKQQYTYHLLTYSADGSESDVAIDPQGKFLQDITISLDDGPGAILCGGLYGTKGEYAVRGAFFLSLDPKTKVIQHESYKEFSDDLITQYMTSREEEKAKKKAERKNEDLELYEYDLNDIVRRDDGGAVLVGEQYYWYTTTNCYTVQGGGQNCTTTWHYFYNDMIVVNIDPQGNIEWASQIPKRQHTTNDGGFFSSYALEVKGSNLYFVYNDNGENLFLAAGDKFKYADFQGKSSIVTLATVNEDGAVKREALFDPEKRDLILRPKAC